MELKKPKRRREPRGSDPGWIVVIVILSIVLVILIAKFASLKTLFWLE